ncbi:MAG: hypothetical protein WDO56_23015 [Gammaproteobacteria bacterium]
MMSLGGDLLFRRVSPAAFDAKGTAHGDGTLFIIMGYEALFALIAGYVTARLAIRRPMTHALAMGGLVLLGRIPTALLAWDTAPPWFHIGVMLLIVPAALLGAKLSELRTRAVH